MVCMLCGWSCGQNKMMKRREGMCVCVEGVGGGGELIVLQQFVTRVTRLPAFTYSKSVNKCYKFAWNFKEFEAKLNSA